MNAFLEFLKSYEAVYITNLLNGNVVRTIFLGHDGLELQFLDFPRIGVASGQFTIEGDKLTTLLNGEPFIVIERKVDSMKKIQELMSKKSSTLDIPVVGDIVKTKEDGFQRIANIRDDYFQLGKGSFFVNDLGDAHMSVGSLGEGRSFSQLVLNARGVNAPVWGWCGNLPEANGGIEFSGEFKVYTLVESED